MKKLLLFLFVALALTGAGRQDLYNFNEKFGGEYTAYVTEGGGTPVFAVEGKSVYSVSYDKTDGKQILGETVTIKNNAPDTKEILYKLGALYHFTSEIGEIKIIYGFSPRLKRVTLVDNKPVNFQITVTEERVTVSNPVNLGSY